MRLKPFKNGIFKSKVAFGLIISLSALIFSSIFAVSPALATHDNIILLTTSEDWHHAMIAGGLSARYYYPLYLTPSNALSEEVKEKLKGPVGKRVIIIGGEDVISASIETELNNLRELYSWQGYWGLQVERVGGKDIYETSALIVDKWPEVNGTIVVRGDIFPDALVASQLSALENSPILFTKSDELPSPILNKIKEEKLDVTIIGGPVAVSEGVENSIRDAGVEVTRIGGKDRYETATMVAERFINKINETGKIIDTAIFVDGVSGEWGSTLGARSYTSNSIILYMGSLPESVEIFLDLHPEITTAFIFIPEDSSESYSDVEELLIERMGANFCCVQKTDTIELSFTTVDKVKEKEKEELFPFTEGDQDEGGGSSGGGSGCG